MPTILALRHAGLVVRDLPRSIAFYTRILGLKAPVVALEQGAFLEHVLACPGVTVTTAKFQAARGECMLELLCFSSPAAAPSPPGEYSFYRLGPTHVAFTVSGLDALLAEVGRAGAAGFRTRLSPSMAGCVSPSAGIRRAICWNL